MNNSISKAMQRPLDDLAKAVILEVDGILVPQERSYPREVGLAYAAGHPGMAWLVISESEWPSATKSATSSSAVSLGYGLSVHVVAGELAAAVRGHKVYSGHPMGVTAWLQKLFGAANVEMAFRVRDLQDLLVVPSGQPASVASELIRAANVRANRSIPCWTRAASDAARHVHFVRGLRGK